MVTIVNPKIFEGNLYLNSTPATKFYYKTSSHRRIYSQVIFPGFKKVLKVFRQALELQCYLEVAGENSKFSVHQAMVSNDKHQKAFLESAKAQAELKFTYVFSCQVYGNQKKSGDIHNRSCYTNILQLMLKYPSLQVAYVDEREETADAKSLKVFYFFLKGGGKFYLKKSIVSSFLVHQLKLDNYFEEAFKLRNVLEEFKGACW
ncbi:putative callose synthase 6 [Raphanus sativus]|nr:putative callose synthase 6 [Raphanus sativus]